jgi:DNA-binding SARP family transcriptional activator
LTTSAFDVALLGELRVRQGDRPLEGELRGRQGKLCFAYLALNRERAVPRAELEEAIWPGERPSDPSAALSTLLSRLRRALEPAGIEGRDSLRLVLPPRSRIDLDTARAALREAEALATDDPAGSRAALDGAAPILGGELLAGFEADWLEQERRGIEELRVRALELAADLGLRLGDAPAAERAARELVQILPYRESSHARLMEALAAQGNSAEALRAYEELRVILRDELGTAPSRRLAELHGGLLEGEVAEPSPSPIPADPGPLPAALRASVAAGPGFVGRDAELARLRELFAARGEVGGRLALIQGDPGIGKTRLCAELGAGLGESGALVLYGRAEETALAQYQPFVEALGSWAGATPEGELRRATDGLPEAARLVPQLRRRLGEPPPAPDSLDRLVVFEEIAELLARISAGRPLLLVLDDLHWADEPTLLLLRHLVRSEEPIDCLIAGTYRITEFESPLTEVVADLGREGPTSELALEGLGENEVAEMIEAGVGSRAAQGTVREVAERSEGNPFFVSELVSELAAGEGGNGGGIPVSRSAAAMVERRLRGFGPDELDRLSLASVIGRDFTFELLLAAGGGDAEWLARLLDEAAAERVAHEVPGTVGRHSFDHALIQDYLYGRVGGQRRAQLHLRVAESLEAISGENPEPYLEQLAHHYAEAAPAGGRDRAIEWSELAGWHAQSLHAHERAAEHFGRAIELLGTEAAPGRRAGLLLARGNCLVKSAHTEAGRSALLEAARVARTLADGELLAEAALGYGDSGGAWSMNTGESDPELVALLEEALMRLNGANPGIRARVTARLATELHWAEGFNGRAEELSRDSVELARRTGDPDLVYRALVDRTMSIWQPDRIDERLALTEESLEWALRSSDRSAEANAAMWRSLVLGEDATTDHGWELVEELATPAVEAAQNAQLRWVHAQLIVNRAIAEGRLSDAGEAIGAMLAVAPGSSDDPQLAASYSGFLVAREAGELGALEAIVDEQLAQLERAPGLAALRVVVGLVLVALDRREEAAEQLRALGDDFGELQLDANWALGASHAAELVSELRDEGRAGRLYEVALASGAERICVLGGGAGMLGSMERYLGLLAQTAGDHAAAIGHLDRAVEINDRKNAPLEAAHARVDLAEALIGEGDAAAAMPLLDEAAAFAGRREGLVRLAARLAGARELVPS